MPHAAPSSVCSRYGVDLVVLGTHGRSALFHILIGSTATEILSICGAMRSLSERPKARPREQRWLT